MAAPRPDGKREQMETGERKGMGSVDFASVLNVVLKQNINLDYHAERKNVQLVTLN